MVGLVLIVIKFTNSTPITTVNEDLEQIVWRQPVSSEKFQIEDALSYNNFSLCRDYFLKDLSGDGILIACSIEGKWKYFTYNKINFQLNHSTDEIIAHLTPPDIEHYIEKKEPKSSSQRLKPTISSEAR